MIRISRKILVAFFIIGFISIVPISMIGFDSIVGSSRELALSFGERSAYYNASIIRTWLDEKSKLLLNIKDELMDIEDEVELLGELNRYAEINDDFISLYIGFDDNHMVDAYGWTPPESYEITDRPWYVKAKDREKTATTSVYMDVNKNEQVIALASGITIDGREGVIASNIYVDYLESIIEDIRFGESGFVLLLDENGQIIAGPGSELKMNIFNGIISQIESRKDAFSLEVTYDEVKYIASAHTIEGYEWSIFLIAPLDDFIESAYAMGIQYLYVVFVVILLIIAVDFFLSRAMSKPIEQLMQNMRQLARGEFEKPVEIKSSDELGILSDELDKMRINLKKIFDTIRYESRILSMNSQTLEEHLDETYKGTRNFMALLSHDIKTPITLIKGYSKGLRMGIIDDEKTKEYFERIEYRADQIEKIVTDILDDTHSVNNLKINMVDITIADYINLLVYNSENLVRNSMKEFEVHVESPYSVDHYKISIDVIKIQRVINNLITNAIKFSPEGSTVVLLLKVEDGELLTAVVDQGIGIDEEDVDKIYNMFYKGNEDTKGYGLGLYINKAIIEAHGGRVYISSKKGEGTTSGYVLKILEHSHRLAL
jgi:signal transduction histidine kinase